MILYQILQNTLVLQQDYQKLQLIITQLQIILICGRSISLRLTHFCSCGFRASSNRPSHKTILNCFVRQSVAIVKLRLPKPCTTASLFRLHFGLRVTSTAFAIIKVILAFHTVCTFILHFAFFYKIMKAFYPFRFFTRAILHES